MKPRFRSLLTNALPALIIVPASMNLAPADVLNVSGTGSISIATGYNAEDSILADGGTDPENFTVTIAQGATLTGDNSFYSDEGIRVTASGYTITNSGTINVGGTGIFVGSEVENTEVDNEIKALTRVETAEIILPTEVEDTEINNEFGALINGGIDGIFFANDGGTVNNEGVISGHNSGITAQNGLIVNNLFDADQNEPGQEFDWITSEITGTYSHAIQAGDSAEISNYGLIYSEYYDGINVGYGATINNNEVLDENTEEVLAIAEIIGGDDGIEAGDDLELENYGRIRGNDGHGVKSGTNLGLVNYADGEIRGSGEGGDGVNFQGSATITNYGYIYGSKDGIGFSSFEKILDAQAEKLAPVLDATTITNHGTIEGERFAIRLGGENDSINLYAGSEIQGDIEGGPGYDTLTFFGGAESFEDVYSNEVFGSVLGMETIYKYGSGTAIIEGSSHFTIPVSAEIQENEVPIYRTTTVQANQIEVYGGALYINGHVGHPPVEECEATIAGGYFVPKTLIQVYGGEIGGTNGFSFTPWIVGDSVSLLTFDGPLGWEADIYLSNGGGISAGSEPQELSSYPLETTEVFVGDSAVESGYPSIGQLIINGSVTHSLYDTSASSTLVIDDLELVPSQPLPTYIKVDIASGTEILEGINSDLIIQTGQDNFYDMTGAEVWIAPTDELVALTNGNYTIIDSERNIIGFDSETTRIGVVVQNPSVLTEGSHLMAYDDTPTSYVSYDTVLGNYFATLHLANPEEELVDEGSEFASRSLGVLGYSETGFGSDLVLSIDYNFSDLPGLTENQSYFGEALDTFIENIEEFEDPALEEFLEDLAMEDLPTTQAALAALDPSSTFGVVQSVVNSNYRLNRVTQNHLAAVRGSSQTTSDVGASAKDAKGVITQGTVTSTTTGRGNVWGTVSYDGQDFDGDLNEADFDGDTGSFTAGIDWLVAPQLIVGLVFDGSKSDMDGQGSNSTEIESFRAAVYGTWGGAMGFYSDFLVGYGSHDLENTKSFGILGNLSSDTDADSLQALWTAGYTMGTDQIKHGPFAGFEYQQADVDGYTQQGIVPIAVGDYDVDSFRGIIGYRVDGSYGKFSPYASVAYAHEFEDGLNTASASVGGNPFTVEGAEQSSAFLISVGTGYALTNALTLDFGYRGEIATDDGITSHGVSLGLNYSF